MALLKYICNDCKHIYEELTHADVKTVCPKCGSENTQRYYRGKCNFGGSAGGGSACAGGSCASCSGCRSN